MAKKLLILFLLFILMDSSIIYAACPGDQITYGSNAWIGYVYANTNGVNPPSDAFTTTYQGYINQP